MTVPVSLLIEANAQGARAELGSVAKGVDGLSAAAKRGKVQLEALAASETRAASTAVKLSGANRMAAGQVGNLTAQFNDIGVMLASGQNPLQLALQQGTQITQVIGPMGAGGAVRALGSAFVGMLNPISLITIGAIAAGAAFFQWLTGAREEAKSLEDAISDLTSGVDAYKRAIREATAPMSEMLKQFGAQASAARAAQDALVNLARQEAQTGVGDAQKSVLKTFDGLIEKVAEYDRVLKTANRSLPATQHLLAAGQKDLRREFGLTIDQAHNIAAALDALSAAKGPEETAAAFSRLSAAIEASRNNSGDLSEKLLEAAKSANKGVLSALELAKAISDGVTEGRSLRDTIAGISFAGAISGANTLLGRLGAALRKTIDLSGALNALREAKQRTLTEQQRILLQEIEIKNRRNGAPEAAIAGLLAGQRERFRLKDTGVPQSIVDQLVAEAQRRGEALATNAATLNDLRTPPKPGGGGGATDASRAALARLIEQQRLQLALLRETDPVQKELLRNRAALAGASDAERAAVAQLIATRQQEQRALAETSRAQAFFKTTGYNAIDGLILRGQKFSDVMRDVARAIASAALKATLLGEGPLMKLFGGSGSGGGFLGGLANFLFPTKAGGGLITGPGSGTSDSVPILASTGEFVVTAAATQQNRHLLEAMNGGARVVPKYASGGIVGPAFPPLVPPPSATGGNPLPGPRNAEVSVRVYVEDDGRLGAIARREGAAAAGPVAVEVVRSGLEEYDRNRLPVSVAEINANPLGIG